MKKILIMKFRNIGDVLLITPLIKNLKLNYPSAKIDIALNKGTEDMVTLNPNVNDIIIYDRKKIKSLNIFKKIIQELKLALNIRTQKYDIIINTTKGDRGAQLAFFSGAKTKIGYVSKESKILNSIFNIHLPNFPLTHMVDVGLDSIRKLQLQIFEKKVEIFWSNNTEKKINKILKTHKITNKNFIHIHPVSRWMFKCINDITMSKIIDYCQLKLKTKVILTASSDKKEIEKINNIISLCQSEPLNLTGKLNLKEVACLNKKAIFFIGVDTAIMHISAANEVPVVAFLGPSAPFHWAPWDNNIFNNQYIETKGIQRMGVHTTIQENWDCVPCDKDGCNGTKISDCLMNLDIKNIKNIIDQYFFKNKE